MKPQEWFYTKEPVMKKVTEEEFKEFLKNYPRRLEGDVCGWAEPPTVTYNDFELANRWPYSIVATKCREYGSFRIMENYEEVFASKTGNVASEND